MCGPHGMVVPQKEASPSMFPPFVTGCNWGQLFPRERPPAGELPLVQQPKQTSYRGNSNKLWEVILNLSRMGNTKGTSGSRVLWPPYSSLQTWPGKRKSLEVVSQRDTACSSIMPWAAGSGAGCCRSAWGAERAFGNTFIIT